MALAIDPALPQADIVTIKRMIPHRYPFLLIDRVVNIEVNRFAVGIKNVTVNEPHFEGHFPVLPVMPGVLIIEAMAQTSAVLVVETLDLIDKDLLVYFMSIDSAKFRHVGDARRHARAARHGDPRPRQDLEVPRRGAGRRHALRRGGVRGDDPVRGRGERERLSHGDRPDRRGASDRRRSRTGPRSAPAAAIGPYCVVGARGGARAAGRAAQPRRRRRPHPIGEDDRVFPFASLGHIPQDLKFRGERVELVIGARNSIREHVTMNPGTAGGGGVTRVGDDNLFMMATHVAHDCRIGNNVIMANNATLGGHCVVERLRRSSAASRRCTSSCASAAAR